LPSLFDFFGYIYVYPGKEGLSAYANSLLPILRFTVMDSPTFQKFRLTHLPVFSNIFFKVTDAVSESEKYLQISIPNTRLFL